MYRGAFISFRKHSLNTCSRQFFRGDPKLGGNLFKLQQLILSKFTRPSSTICTIRKQQTPTWRSGWNSVARCEKSRSATPRPPCLGYVRLESRWKKKSVRKRRKLRPLKHSAVSAR